MFLSVDVGNTQTRLGLVNEDGCVVHHWRTKTDRLDTADEITARLLGLFTASGRDFDDVDAVAVACVVPDLLHAWRTCLTRLDRAPLMVSSGAGAPIPVALPHPEAVGADRIANAVEARRLYGAPAIVVDFGTATNIDVVDPRGAFVGGVIAPGIMLSASALFSRASKLSGVPIEMPERTIGDSSEHALQSGIVIGTAAMAEGLVARIKDELGVEECPVIATGGLARTVSMACRCFTSVDADLTLRGIHQLWRAQR